MLDVTRIAFPRSLERRGFTLKSKMMSLATRSMRDFELSTICIVPHFFFSSSFEFVESFSLGLEPVLILSSERKSLVDVRRLINQV